MTDPLASFGIGRFGDIAVVSVEGEVDLSNAARLRSVSVRAVQPVDTGLVLDLASTGYLDSAGIRAVLEVQRDLEQRRQRLVVVAPPQARVAAVLVLTGIPSVVPMVDDIPAAIEALRTTGA